MLRDPDPGTFEHLIRTVRRDCTHWVRMSRSPSTEPFYSRTASRRFDDPSPPGARFGVLYVAEDLETAFCESVLHENALFHRGRFVVPDAELTGRVPVRFVAVQPGNPSVTRKLALANLTGAALKAMGLANEISAGGQYSMTQQWARAIHDARADIDGIQYVSRQHNAKRCFAIFDRAGLRRAADSPERLTDAELARLVRKYRIEVGLP